MSRAAALLACFVVACRDKPIECHAWRAPGGALGSSDVATLQKRDDDPCKALGSAAIEVRTDGLALDGQMIATRSELSVHARDIAALTADLKTDRETWKLLHPGREFPSKLDVSFEPTTDVALGERVLRSASLASFASMHVHVGGEDLAFVHGDSEAMRRGESEPVPMLFITLRKDGLLDVRLERLGSSGWPPKHTELDADAVATFITRECGSAPCVELVAVGADEGPFVTLVRIAKTVLRAAPLVAHPPHVTFEAPAL